ncbi:MAG: flagellar biosynthetic protein FliR [Rhodospirillales bacterium]
MLAHLAIGEAWAALIVFLRVGTVLSFLPGFSAAYVSLRIRLMLALGLSVMLTPLLASRLPALPGDIAGLAVLVLGEVLIGVFLGIIPRIAVSALQTAGTFISFFASLASAVIQDPVADQQSATLAGFLNLLGLVLIFVTDLHHLMLSGLVASYEAFPAGAGLPIGDAADMLARAVAASFAIGLQLSLPSLIACLLSNVALGLLGRLMPQLNVFFFGMPIQISIQFFLLMMFFSGMSIVFLNYFAETLTVFGPR